MDKDVAHIIHYYSATKKNGMTFATTWMDLGKIVVSEVRQTLYGITYAENLKHNTNEFTYKIQTHSHRKRTYGC